MTYTWVIVADRARARLFSVNAGAAHLDEIQDFVNLAARAPGHGQQHAPPPRVHDRFGQSRHVIEAHTSPREKAALNFAAELATFLQHAHATSRYQYLALVAPPGFLGTLKSALGAPLRAILVQEISKNMTRVKADAIRDALPSSWFRRHVVAMT